MLSKTEVNFDCFCSYLIWAILFTSLQAFEYAQPTLQLRTSLWFNFLFMYWISCYRYHFYFVCYPLYMKHHFKPESHLDSKQQLGTVLCWCSMVIFEVIFFQHKRFGSSWNPFVSRPGNYYVYIIYNPEICDKRKSISFGTKFNVFTFDVEIFFFFLCYINLENFDIESFFSKILFITFLLAVLLLKWKKKLLTFKKISIKKFTKLTT